MKVILAIIALLLPLSTFSAYEVGDRKISSMRISHSYIKFRLSPAPAGCQGNDDYRMHVYIDQNAENKDDMVAALLTAYAADMTLSVIWYEDGGSCGIGSSLKLIAFELKQK